MSCEDKKSNDGFKEDNKITSRSGPLITPKELKEIYLFGITIRNDEGEVIDDGAYQIWINNAVSMLEHYLDIFVSPQKVTEYKDYRMNDYMDWGYLYLNNFPLINIESLKMVYFRDEDGEPQVVQEIPKSWFRLQENDGLLRLVPNSRFPANLQIDNLGNYFPEILRASLIPHTWQIVYNAGFKDGKIPHLINQAIALLAAIQGLIIGGHLVLGAGISSQSISLDGLSQSIQSTNSAENSAYGANIKEYQKILFGDGPNDKENGIIHQLKEFYKGQTVGII